MSEYQYYEFQAVDRALTRREMEELRRYSSRAQITPTSFVNTYDYGDFRGDPEELVEKYFDVFLYLANWGTRWLMLRVPGKLLDPKTAAAYGTTDCLSCRLRGDHAILSFRSEDEEDCELAEDDDWLAWLAPIRAELMHGDHRALYLGWLLAVQAAEIDDDALEPPVPAGLGDLDAPLAGLADFLRIDMDLITAAAEQSTARPNTSLSEKELADWISRLPGRAKDTLLARLIVVDDPHLVIELRQQALDPLRGAASNSSAPRRTAAHLLERANALGEARREKAAATWAREKAEREREAAARKKKRLESLRGGEESLWNRVDGLIGTRQPRRYDEAVSLLRDLLDLAQMQGDASAFTARMARLHAEHARKTTLVERFREAKLIG